MYHNYLQRKSIIFKKQIFSHYFILLKYGKFPTTSFNINKLLYWNPILRYV